MQVLDSRQPEGWSEGILAPLPRVDSRCPLVSCVFRRVPSWKNATPPVVNQASIECLHVYKIYAMKTRAGLSTAWVQGFL